MAENKNNSQNNIKKEIPGIFSESHPKWPDFQQKKLTDKYILRLLKDCEREHIEYAEFWRKAYPELYKGPLDFILQYKNYHKIFGHEKSFMKGPFCALVFEEIGNKIFGGAILILDYANKTAQGVIMSVLPEYRNKNNTGKYLYRFIEEYDRLIQNSGVEYAWVAATANHKITQKLLKHVNYRVRGIIPGMSISSINKFYYRRDNYVYMDKFYNNGDKIVSEEMQLIPEAHKIWNIINR